MLCKNGFHVRMCESYPEKTVNLCIQVEGLLLKGLLRRVIKIRFSFQEKNCTHFSDFLKVITTCKSQQSYTSFILYKYTHETARSILPIYNHQLPTHCSFSYFAIILYQRNKYACIFIYFSMFFPVVTIRERIQRAFKIRFFI